MSSRRRRKPRPSDEDNGPATNEPNDAGNEKPVKRLATVYDAVAGRIGLNGFLTAEQLASSTINPLAPEEVILGRNSAPEQISDDFYNAEENHPAARELPESDLLKAVHAYTSDFYGNTTRDQGKYDFRSLDETALLAVGILLEEAARDVLGENGDMVLVEPEGLEHGLPETKMTMHQIKGRVEPSKTPDYAGQQSESEDVERPRKRRR